MPEEDKKEPTAADILRAVGFALFSHAPDWQARLARDLNIDKDTIRNWHRGRPPLTADHPIFDELLELADERIDEIVNAGDRLRGWLAAQRK